MNDKSRRPRCVTGGGYAHALLRGFTRFARTLSGDLSMRTRQSFTSDNRLFPRFPNRKSKIKNRKSLYNPLKPGQSQSKPLKAKIFLETNN